MAVMHCPPDGGTSHRSTDSSAYGLKCTCTAQINLKYFKYKRAQYVYDVYNVYDVYDVYDV